MSALDAEKICRLCCEKKVRLRSLFEQRQENGPSLPDIISDISRLQVERNDGMPQQICRLCTNTLVKMYETIESYRANDLMLRKQLGIVPMIEIKEEEVDVELLEHSFTLELEVDDIAANEDPMEEEYLEESEIVNDETTANEELNDQQLPQQVDSDHSNGKEFANDDDEDWKPTEQKEEKKKSPVKQRRRKRKVSPDAEPKKSGRRRKKEENPDRPRKHDFKCYICKSDSHGTPEGLLAHLNSSHLDMLPYNCPECVTEPVIIKHIVQLHSHVRQHLNPAKCPHCDKRYADKNSVEQHVQLHHSDDASKPSYSCEQCGENYPSKTSLMYHMKLHTSAVSCELCGKVFKERSKLRRHIQNRHEKLRKYECHICQKKLATMDSLQNHVKVFHSSQTFKCSYCPKTFGLELTHRLHEKKHLDNPGVELKQDWKQYYTILEGEENKPDKLKKCNFCGVITKGMGTHLQKVHFPSEHRCSICAKVFTTKGACKSHELQHEQGTPQQCPICGREFSDRRYLLTHLRTKNHQDHPLAVAILSTVRPKSSVKPEETECDEEELDV